MKKYFYFATAAVLMVGCSSDSIVDGGYEPQPTNEDAAIVFSTVSKGTTRAGDLVGATAAKKLGNMFVVEGTKGTEQTNSPSTDVVFDNYLVGYVPNTAATTESNSHNWEYVGLQSGITGKLSSATWTALHGTGTAQTQSVKYWDYSTSQYDFIAWSTGGREAVTTTPTSGSSVQVTRIQTGPTLSTDGFTLTAQSAADLLQCYYTDINTVQKTEYGKPVTLTFKNMAAKVRIGLYETVPGYSVTDVKFYSSDANPTGPTDLGTGTSEAAALFTMGDDKLPQSGSVHVYYNHIGSSNKTKADYNKASVTVTPGSTTASTQAFGNLANFVTKEFYETAATTYLGRKVTETTYAGSAANNYYTAVFPNSNGKPLTLRVDYTLLSTDGSGEEINIYGAKAVVPAIYTAWQPNYAYTYIFKISDNSNGWTSKTNTDRKGLFPITFDAVVTNFVDANAEQTTVTTVATPSITTYQQGHEHANKDEYSKSQVAGASSEVKDLYVQVMDNSGTTSTLKNDLNTDGKSLLFAVSKTNASEAEVMDALQNRTNEYNSESPVGRNGITLTKNTHIDNTVTSIVNGIDDQPITVDAGTAAKIDIDHAEVTAGTYAYVYCTTVPTSDEKVYHVAAVSGSTEEEKNTDAQKYYEVAISTISTTAKSAGDKAAAGKVYFVKNADNSYTFKQTKVGDDVAGLYEASIPTSKATSYTATNFYFDVYNQNNGNYAVKIIKVVAAP